MNKNTLRSVITASFSEKSISITIWIDSPYGATWEMDRIIAILKPKERFSQAPNTKATLFAFAKTVYCYSFFKGKTAGQVVQGGPRSEKAKIILR